MGPRRLIWPAEVSPLGVRLATLIGLYSVALRAFAMAQGWGCRLTIRNARMHDHRRSGFALVIGEPEERAGGLSLWPLGELLEVSLPGRTNSFRR